MGKDLDISLISGTPGRTEFGYSGPEVLREVRSSDVMADLRRKVVALSGDGTRSSSKRKNSEERVDVTPARDGTVRKGATNPISSVGAVLDTREAMKLTVEARGSLEGNVSGTGGKKCNESGALNLEQSVKCFLKRAMAKSSKLAAEEVQRRWASVIAVREDTKQVLPTGVAKEPRDMGLGQQFETFRRALRGDPPEQVEPLRVTRKDEVHTVGKSAQPLQGYSAHLGQSRYKVHNIE